MELPALDPQELAADVAKDLRMSFGFSFPRDVFFSNYPYTYPLRIP